MVRQGQHPTDEPASLPIAEAGPRVCDQWTGRGTYALWLAWMAGALVFIPTACVYAIICARMMLGIGSFICVRRLQQALRKGASSASLGRSFP